MWIRPSQGVLAASLVALGACSGDEPTPPDSVLFVVVDTLRADRLSCYGYGRETSPSLDRLASEGVRFERCVAQSNWTKPTTATLLTGLLPSEHGAAHVTSSIDAGAETLAETLAAAGYRTGAFVTNAFVRHAGSGFARGFETFRGYAGEEPRRYVRAGPVIDDALDWLDEVRGEPFLAYVHLMDPHAPYDPPPAFEARFGGGYDGPIDGYFGLDPDALEQPDTLSPADWARLGALYDGEVAYVDAQFGRLLAGLRARGRAEDTVVVFVADHGEEFGEHDGWRHGPGLYEEVVRVPLVLRLPRLARARRGASVDALVSQVDVVPTLLDALGLPARADSSGRSLMPHARGEAGRDDEHAVLIETDESGVQRRALVVGDWKYVRTFAPVLGERLHDLATDPGERLDVAGAHPARTAALRARLDELVARGPAAFTLVLQNATARAVEVEVFVVTSRAPLARIAPLYAEELARPTHTRDGPLVREHGEKYGETVHLARFALYTTPGDSDGIVFEPAAGETRLALEVLVDGERLDPRALLLGADGRPADTMPVELEPGGEPLLSPRQPAREELDAPLVRARLWRERGRRTADGTLSEEERATIRATGYGGDD